MVVGGRALESREGKKTTTEQTADSVEPKAARKLDAENFSP